MFSKTASLFVLAASAVLPALGRERWAERDGHAVLLHPRRFGQENPAVISKLSAACSGQVCGVLAGSAISTLLAASPECAQQDKADEIINASRQFDAATQALMIQLAIEFRQTEKNTPPDFTVNPPKARNSVFCQKAPQNKELDGLVQAQDPANDNVTFFDPATKSTVLLDQQANTRPFRSSGGAAPQPPQDNQPEAEPSAPAAGPGAPNSTAQCPGPLTVTVTGAAPAGPTTNPAPAAPASGNLQKFAGQLGGVVAPTVLAIGGGKFQVTGNAAFNNLQSALIRSCDVQNNQCANKFNAGDKSIGGVGACNAQQATCIAQARSA
jgi:hypothetical protein